MLAAEEERVVAAEVERALERQLALAAEEERVVAAEVERAVERQLVLAAEEELEAEKAAVNKGEAARFTAPGFQSHSSSKQDHLPRSSQRWVALHPPKHHGSTACFSTGPGCT